MTRMTNASRSTMSKIRLGSSSNAIFREVVQYMYRVVHVKYLKFSIANF